MIISDDSSDDESIQVLDGVNTSNSVSIQQHSSRKKRSSASTSSGESSNSKKRNKIVWREWVGPDAYYLNNLKRQRDASNNDIVLMYSHKSTKLNSCSTGKRKSVERSETKTWHCPRCTFENSDLKSVCELCGAAIKTSDNSNPKYSQFDENLQVHRKQSAEEEQHDEEFARKLQQEEYDRNMQAAEEIDKDKALAQLLQQEEDKMSKRADPSQEHQEMTKNITGKAFLLVKKIVELATNLKSHKHFSHLVHTCSIENVAVDDLVYLSERLLTQQEDFANGQNSTLGINDIAAAGSSPPIPTHIDVCYHYTNPRNMDNIRTNGLMSLQERTNQNISSQSNGASFGDGIYTANNPTSFCSYGTVGLIVACLLGNTVKAQGSIRRNSAIDSANTIIGNKSGSTTTDEYHEFVLQKSSQCLPMLKYDGNLLQQPDGKRCIGYLHNELQQNR